MVTLEQGQKQTWTVAIFPLGESRLPPPPPTPVEPMYRVTSCLVEACAKTWLGTSVSLLLPTEHTAPITPITRYRDNGDSVGDPTAPSGRRGGDVFFS